MRAADEYQMVRKGIFFWQVHEPKVKTELCSCAVETQEGLVFVDPVPLEEAVLDELLAGRKAAGIVLTSENHERGAKQMAARLGVETWAHAGAQGEVAANWWFKDGEVLFGAMRVIALPGFAKGESALWLDPILMVGDALIHAAPYGFSLLPEKYCEDPKEARESARKLLQFPVELLTFAHGLPIVARAGERLATLLQ